MHFCSPKGEISRKKELANVGHGADGQLHGAEEQQPDRTTHHAGLFLGHGISNLRSRRQKARAFMVMSKIELDNGFI